MVRLHIWFGLKWKVNCTSLQVDAAKIMLVTKTVFQIFRGGEALLIFLRIDQEMRINSRFF